MSLASSKVATVATQTVWWNTMRCRRRVSPFFFLGFHYHALFLCTSDTRNPGSGTPHGRQRCAFASHRDGAGTPPQSACRGGMRGVPTAAAPTRAGATPPAHPCSTPAASAVCAAYRRIQHWGRGGRAATAISKQAVAAVVPLLHRPTASPHSRLPRADNAF